jgi:hypothetical protein
LPFSESRRGEKCPTEIRQQPCKLLWTAVSDSLEQIDRLEYKFEQLTN